MMLTNVSKKVVNTVVKRTAAGGTTVIADVNNEPLKDQDRIFTNLYTGFDLFTIFSSHEKIKN